MMEIECPFCNHEFEVKTWWDEMCTEDYSDCWAIVEWNREKDK